MNATTINNTMAIEMAELINDNRYIAAAQLSADDMTTNLWKDYRTACDILAVQAWNSLNKRVKEGEENLFAFALAGLFNFFGSDAKATPDVCHRFVLSCVTVKVKKSDAFKKAEKALREAKVALSELEEKSDATEEAIAAAKSKVEDCEAVKTELAAQPKNKWYEFEPMLDKTKKHASPKCRKLIEDTMADLMHERALMTAEEKQAEAQRLADERKGRKMRKQEEAKAEKSAK